MKENQNQIPGTIFISNIKMYSRKIINYSALNVINKVSYLQKTFHMIGMNAINFYSKNIIVIRFLKHT